ncbi:hypothetical protein HGM15179_014716 [Zosterops borbonicus]|uniref:Uncharacterized protein n=1 Tax=Zosterops borbonicus TaxID=364589 RepID=A0A8K1G5Q0_9PASS|nr:hypothetical protein HGM15179_014716 [Zosterops borbonicus]
MSQGDNGTTRYLTMLLSSSRSDMGQRLQTLRYHESDFISLEFIALCLASTLALPLPNFPASQQKRQPDSQTKRLANLDKNHFLANARKKFLCDNDTNLINLLAIPSALRRNKQNEISIRLTHEIDIRKSFSRNETMRPDEIREGHQKEIRTIQPILDTWTA